MTMPGNDTPRNAPCPCGSGRRFKHCHGSFSVTERMMADMNMAAARSSNEVTVFGKAKRMASFEFHGERWVGVGPVMHHSPNWKTPIDFLGFYIRLVLGDEWGAEEEKKPFEERHPVLQWSAKVGRWHASQSALPSGLKEAFATGTSLAFYSIAFDLWMVANNGLLDDSLIQRLRLIDAFQGARYELWLRAVFLKAGYKIELEDETTGPTHCEFNARNPGTGRWLSVEAKSTSRAGHLGKTVGSAEMVVRINSNLKDALKKEAKHDRIVFIDLNLPPHEGDLITSDWARQASDEIKHRQEAMTSNANDVRAYLILTNQPFHYVNESVWTQRGMVLASAINIDGFLVGAPTSSEVAGAAEWSDQFRATHPELTELMLSLQDQQAIPTEFP